MEELETTRHPTLLLITYSAFYSAAFLLGLLGNTFAVLSVILHPQLRSSTDYLISSLATADLLIILFCLPTTLLNNLLTGYYYKFFFYLPGIQLILLYLNHIKLSLTYSNKFLKI
uniref:G_PROTEIN_RECEP_F1_2 domain-containing protein n=1 Tax=Onchocerca volvulus TaxID=6282 RepID=A0A8R1TW25_ONCVO